MSAAWGILAGFLLGLAVAALVFWPALRRARRMLPRSTIAPQPPGSLPARVMAARGVIFEHPGSGLR